MCKNLVLTNDEVTTLRESIDGTAVRAQLVYHASPSPCSKTSHHPQNEHASHPTVKTHCQDSSGTRVFTRQQVADMKSAGKLWIIIHDNVYDVTDYQHEHPGGKLVLQHLAGKDATDAFENYHRAHVAKYLLPRYNVGKLQDPTVVPAHVKDFRGLRQELLRRGMFEVPMGYYRILYLRLAALFVLALYLTLGCHSVTCHMLGAVLLGVFWQQFAGLGHDLGHASVSKRLTTDHWMGSVIGASLTGLSTAWWKSSHNTHHVVPNSVEHDPDIQHMPILAISPEVIQKPYWSSYHEKMFCLDRLAAFCVGYQHLLFFPLMALARFNLYAQGIIFLVARTKLHLQSRQWLHRHEIICILGVFLVWYLAVALTLPTWTERVAWVVLSHAVTAVLHLQIVISHWSRETYRSPDDGIDTNNSDESANQKSKDCDKGNDETEDNDEDDWYLLQLRTTMDIACPAWMDWAHIGLQFQTTHHLYPTLPRPHLREATAMVKKVCQKHGMEYYEKGFFAMLCDSFQALQTTAAEARSGKYTTTTESLQSLREVWNAQG